MFPHGSHLIDDSEQQCMLGRLRYKLNETLAVGVGYFGIWYNGAETGPNPHNPRLQFEGHATDLTADVQANGI